jgi:hypothetical protein
MRCLAIIVERVITASGPTPRRQPCHPVGAHSLERLEGCVNADRKMVLGSAMAGLWDNVAAEKED